MLLSSRNLRQDRPSHKLSDKYLGPFKVVSNIGPVAVKLELPDTMSRIHPVFHVSNLKPYHGTPPERPPPIVVGDELEYEVEKVIAERGTRARKEYRVRWTGYGPEEDTWVKEKDLGNAQEILTEWRNSGQVSLEGGQ